MTEQEVIEQWAKDYAWTNANDLLFIRRLREALSSDVEVAAVLMILDNICQSCWDREGPCSCWNDE